MMFATLRARVFHGPELRSELLPFNSNMAPPALKIAIFYHNPFCFAITLDDPTNYLTWQIILIECY